MGNVKLKVYRVAHSRDCKNHKEYKIILDLVRLTKEIHQELLKGVPKENSFLLQNHLPCLWAKGAAKS